MIRKAINYLTVVLEWVAIACFSATVLLVIVSVFLRPLKIAAPWSDEGACLLFIWVTFLSAAISVKRNLHIRIDVLLLKLPPKLKGGFLCFLDLLCLPFCIGLMYGIYQMMQASFYMRSSVLETPMVYYYLPLFIGFTMMAVYLVISVLDFILIKPKKSEDR
ncbi:MAG: TRAP transporter small permease subunit [Deltaproteobacteria bacterium]|nr:TRAP transporter small permease subunit [Deltaproteobacteria bacterium]